MTLVPLVGALVTGHGPGDIGDFFAEGLDSVMNVVAVTTGTAAIGIVAHLDGSSSTTFLLTIPALLPLYRALGISRYILITIVALAASVMNMVPWAGPLGRAGAVIAQEPRDIWLRLLPIQGVAIVLVLVVTAAMLEQIALSLVSVLPAAVGPYLHVIVRLLGVPLDLLTSTDAYYFSVLPIVQETAASFGVSGMVTALALIIGNVIGTFVSPFSPALWLALGLAGGANMGRYIKLAVPIAWAFSAALVLAAFAFSMLG